MPKIADVKSKSRSKRKPLSDVSNGGFKSVTNTVMKKSNPDTQRKALVTTCGGGGCQDPLDRLLLVHSDLSVLIHQIDELVVQALDQKVSNKKEIESFTLVLTDIQTSLKPWIPRFQKLLTTSTNSTVSKNQSQTTLTTKKIPPSTNENQDSYKLDFLVSPSPLVSWRADCTQEGGKNLFMLTPLPKPSPFSSKLNKSSKSVLKNKTNDVPFTIKTNPNLESEFTSPEKLVQRNNDSIIVSTPYLKMSPPKSCKLLEPVSEHCNKNSKGTKDGGDSENSSGELLGLKYPEIFGIRNMNKLGNVRKTVEESPNWCMSPPKTCVILEPSDDEDVGINFNKHHNEVAKTLAHTTQKKIGGLERAATLLHQSVIDSTPMCKDIDTTVVRGKRAGENTLKKELWMRFEAATGHEFRFKPSTVVGGKTTTTSTSSSSNDCNKGFMDLLEEVCSDD